MFATLLFALALNATDCPTAERLARVDETLLRRPTDATLHFWRATALIGCNHADDALVALDRVREFGDGFLPIRGTGFDPLWDDARFVEQRNAFEAALPKIVDASVAFRAKGRDLIPEGVAYDAKTGTLYLGSAAKQQILAIDANGQRVFASGLHHVLGLHFAPSSRRLYAISTSSIFRGADGENAVVSFDEHGNRLQTWIAAHAANLNDVTVARDGTIYASDAGGGAVFRAKPGETALTAWIEPGSLAGANGLALDEANDRLFVAHATGIAKAEIATERLDRLTGDTRETIASIDGLYLAGDELIGIQNVTNPGRVIAIRLNAAHTELTGVRTLLSHHHPALHEPTTGVVDGARFLVLANSHFAALQTDGSLADPESLRDPVILAVPLRRD